MKSPLIVLVPGMLGDPKCFDELKEILIEEKIFSNPIWLDFEYKRNFFSNSNLDHIAFDLSNTIDNFFALNKDRISEIILVGHSMGTALLRRAYLNALGYGLSTSLSQSWVLSVDRIILMGALGRGVVVNNFALIERTAIKIGIFLARLFGFGKMKLSLLSGADFISRLRIDWIKYNREHKMRPLVIHLLGKKDRVVKPEDVIDLEQFSNSIPIGVPNTGHRKIIYPNQHTRNPLIRSFKEIPEKTRETTVDEEERKIYFLLHGIRDSRDCFIEVKKQIENQSPNAKIVMPTYGYLSAGDFLISRFRNSLIPWFVDQFTEYLARHPKSEFYFAGHSNGTYIIGEALKRVPSMSFKRIYLAASVLPPEYQWDDRVKKFNQVDFLRFDMGTEDWPVSILCRVLNKLGVKSIGPGGADGFEWDDNEHVIHNKFNGGHSSMLVEDNTKSIADFLLRGEKKGKETPLNPPTRVFTFFKKFGDIIIPLLILILVFGTIYFFSFFSFPYNVLGIIGTMMFIWLVLDRA